MTSSTFFPGIYSLTATSEDERAALECVLSHEVDLYVNVVDATTLERNLYLTLLMCELKVPMVVVVTMMDIARHRNIDIALDHLSEHLGVPVIGVNGNNPLDIRRLQLRLSEALIPNPRSLKSGNTRFLLNRHTRPIADGLLQTCQSVEDRRLPAIRITNQTDRLHFKPSLRLCVSV